MSMRNTFGLLMVVVALLMCATSVSADPVEEAPAFALGWSEPQTLSRDYSEFSSLPDISSSARNYLIHYSFLGFSGFAGSDVTGTFDLQGGLGLGYTYISKNGWGWELAVNYFTFAETSYDRGDSDPGFPGEDAYITEYFTARGTWYFQLWSSHITRTRITRGTDLALLGGFAELGFYSGTHTLKPDGNPETERALDSFVVGVGLVPISYILAEEYIALEFHLEVPLRYAVNDDHLDEAMSIGLLLRVTLHFYV